jgi:hypothetical protein
VSAASAKDPLARRAVRQAGIQGQATLAGVRARAIVRRTGGRVLVGPWLAEVGFELLYWIPFARRLLRGAGLAPGQAVVLSRGGVEAWYGDAFGEYLDLYDLFDPDELHQRQRERIAASGGQKHVAVTDLDRDAIARARSHLGEELTVLHPSLMFRRFRPVWMRRRTTAAVLRETAPERIRDLPREPLLPERYAAVKLYASDCLPIEADAAQQLAAVVCGLVGDLPLVTLSAGARVDDHTELFVPEGPPGRAELSANLRRQTAIIQHADALVCTYGGFAYLGPLCGTRTIGLYQRANFNVLHLDVFAGEWEQLRVPGTPGLSLIDVEHLNAGAAQGRMGEQSRTLSRLRPSRRPDD